jgi:flagellar hook protein FlgE
MIDSIYISMTGLVSYQKGLRAIANDTSNLNTPGFKGSSLLFGDLFYTVDPAQGSEAGNVVQYGFGVNTLGTRYDFTEGQLQSSSNPLDLAVDGEGFFVLRDDAGEVHYTRDGQFKFNDAGKLVSAATGEQVLGLDASGAQVPISIANLAMNAAQPTSSITFKGNLDSTSTTYTVASVNVIDRLGASHTLSVRFDGVTGSPGTWNVTLLDGTATVGTGQIGFTNGVLDTARGTATITYSPADQTPMPITLDFTNNVTSFESGGNSNIAVNTSDGHTAGNLTGTAVDPTGTLVLSYSNGQTVKSTQLALARFTSPDAVNAVGNNEFEVTLPRNMVTGVSGTNGFGSIKSSTVETSNVDMSQEFSQLVILQRGYQASSQVLQTASEMLSELFNLRGGK